MKKVSIPARLFSIISVCLCLTLLFAACGGGGGGGAPEAVPASTGTATPTPTPSPIPTSVATPVIQVPTGKSLLSGSKIGITNSEAGATIYYTLDGSTPTASSNVYTGLVTINNACTIKAVAIKQGVTSSIASAAYSIAARKASPDAEKDIVFKDGTATAYTTNLYLTENYKQDAIAMIFYKGSDCSDDGTSRTLGVGLKYEICVPDWCWLNSAAQNNNIDTIQENVKNGSQNLEKIGAWLTAHSLTDDTGTYNNYPSFHLAKSYGSNNETFTDGWYLPSKAELQKIYNQKVTINAILDICGLDSNIHYLNEYFWSSSQSSSYDTGAYYLDFRNGTWHNEDKITSLNFTWAIREF